MSELPVRSLYSQFPLHWNTAPSPPSASFLLMMLFALSMASLMVSAMEVVASLLLSSLMRGALDDTSSFLTS